MPKLRNYSVEFIHPIEPAEEFPYICTVPDDLNVTCVLLRKYSALVYPISVTSRTHRLIAYILIQVSNSVTAVKYSELSICSYSMNFIYF